MATRAARFPISRIVLFRRLISPSAINPSCRETIPRKTARSNSRRCRRSWNRREGERKRERERKRELVNKAEDRLHKVAIFETTTTTREFYVFFVFVSDFRSCFPSVQLATDPSLLPLAVMRNHAFRLCYAEKRYALCIILPLPRLDAGASHERQRRGCAVYEDTDSQEFVIRSSVIVLFVMWIVSMFVILCRNI